MVLILYWYNDCEWCSGGFCINGDFFCNVGKCFEYVMFYVRWICGCYGCEGYDMLYFIRW